MSYSPSLQTHRGVLNPCPAETRIYLAFAKSVDPDQLASGSALFVIKFMNLYQQPKSKLEVRVAS